MLYALIIAGGKGQRFWPKSTTARPKYLLPFTGKRSLLQETVHRAKWVVPASRIWVITIKQSASAVGKQLIGFPGIKIVQEPFGRNTAAAVGLGAVLIKRIDPDAVIMVLPADHLIKDRKKFCSAVRLCARAARSKKALVTVGVKPTYPATGYGYIQLDPEDKSLTRNSQEKIFRVKRFIEKPDKKTARRFLNSSRYLWNSGMFFWRAKVILGEIENHLPGLFRGLTRIEKARSTSSRQKVIRDVYKNLKPDSIDYGVMEKAKNVLCLKTDFSWDDCGSWLCLERLYQPDKNGNIFFGNVAGMDARNSIIFGSKNRLIAALGVKDLIVIATGDVVMICPKKKAEKVKDLVEDLKKRKFTKYI